MSQTEDLPLDCVPKFEEFLEKFNALQLDRRGNSNDPASHSDEIVEFARQEVLTLSAYLDKIRDVRQKTTEFHDEIGPFLKEISEEVVRLDDLYRMRGLLLRLNTIKEVHEKMEWLLSSKATKQFEIDSKLLQSVELFQRIVQAYDEIAKSSPPTNAMRVYTKNVMSYWHEELKRRLELRFETILKQISWPLVGINALPGSASIVQASATFDTFFTALLKIEIRHLFDDDQRSDKKIKICLPMELMILPLRKRFIYHFMKSSRTNQLEKPEWCLTQTLNWIKDNSEFLVKNVDPILKLNSGDEWASSKVQFTCGLLELVKAKLKADLEELLYDDKLFSHTYDEGLSFSRELELLLGGNKLLIKHNCNLFSLFTSEPYFSKLISLERTKSTEYVEAILESPTAWLPLITPMAGDDEGDEDELKAPEAVDNFVILLQSISDRSNFIADVSAMQAFIELQLEMLEDFRVRLTQLVRANQSEEAAERKDNVKRWPFSSKYFGILNAINYLIKVLEEWRLTPFFIEATNASIDALLDEAISLFKHMLQDMRKRIIKSFNSEIRFKIFAYSSLKWFCLQPGDDNARLVSCELLHFISLSLEKLKVHLASSLFKEICHTLAKDLNRTFLEDVILKSTFNEEGAKFITRDITINLCSLFSSYVRKAEPLFAETIEATTLLCLQRGTAILLEEAQYTPEEDDCLSDLGIEALDTELAVSISKRRIYL